MNDEKQMRQCLSLPGSMVLIRAAVLRVIASNVGDAVTWRVQIKAPPEELPIKEAITLPTEDEGIEAEPNGKPLGHDWSVATDIGYRVGWVACDAWWRKRLGLES